MTTMKYTTILKIIFSEMKKIQNKIDQESDEIKKKEYYSSSEYKMMEKKKKKVGLSRMKTKTVSLFKFSQIFRNFIACSNIFESKSSIPSILKIILRQLIKVVWLKSSGRQKFDSGLFSNWESKLLWKWFSSIFTTSFKNNSPNK